MLSRPGPLPSGSEWSLDLRVARAAAGSQSSCVRLFSTILVSSLHWNDSRIHSASSRVLRSTWKLVSAVREEIPSGAKVNLFGDSPQGFLNYSREGRMIALVGDAELDEGNVYEALIEAYKHDIRNCWWIVDYNRQSLDATSADRMFERFKIRGLVKARGKQRTDSTHVLGAVRDLHLLELVAEGNTWVKLSGPNRLGVGDLPPWPDVVRRPAGITDDVRRLSLKTHPHPRTGSPAT